MKSPQAQFDLQGSCLPIFKKPYASLFVSNILSDVKQLNVPETLKRHKKMVRHSGDLNYSVLEFVHSCKPISILFVMQLKQVQYFQIFP